MKKQEKIAKYVAMGLTQEQAERLITYGQDDYLSLKELSIKYDNPKLLTGEYPHWLTPEDHYKMCQKVAVEKYDFKKFKGFMEKEDLVIDLYIWSYIRLFKFKNVQVLKVALNNRVKNLLRDYITKETKKVKTQDATKEQLKEFENFSRINGDSYIIGSLDNTLSVDEDSTYESIIPMDDEYNKSRLETVETIRTLKNKQVRQILIICGYLLADLDELSDDFRDVLQNCSPKVRDNLKKLCSIQLQYEQDEMNNVKIKDRKRRIKQITVTDIVKAFDLQEQLQALCTDTENIEKYESIKIQYKNVPTKKGLKTKLNLEQVLAQSIVEDLKYYLVTNNLFGSLSLI